MLKKFEKTIEIDGKEGKLEDVLLTQRKSMNRASRAKQEMAPLDFFYILIFIYKNYIFKLLFIMWYLIIYKLIYRV